MEIAKKVSGGYPRTFGLDDYTNDLSVRDRINLMLEPETAHVNSDVTECVERADEIFRASTINIERPVVPYSTDDQWWRRRIPLSRGPDFERDLKEFGLS